MTRLQGDWDAQRRAVKAAAAPVVQANAEDALAAKKAFYSGVPVEEYRTPVDPTLADSEEIEQVENEEQESEEDSEQDDLAAEKPE